MRISTGLSPDAAFVAMRPQPPPGVPANRLSFDGHTVVFTGKLSSLSRKEAQALVLELGGSTAEDVTSRTTILVIGAGDSRRPGRLRARVRPTKWTEPTK